ncbi:hypothetical protein [Amycolatopsis australiensis]|uniref:hypothetical protein n=1 Tax=Amycolatopsis australiensis TaxID=546364 RepID=UPI0015A69325|nr:hypothetical protein [Amycolatopsis australiensis]
MDPRESRFAYRGREHHRLDQVYLARIDQTTRRTSTRHSANERAGLIERRWRLAAAVPTCRDNVCLLILVARRGTGATVPGMIGFTLPKIRRLLTKLVLRVTDAADHIRARSSFRRRRQHQVRLSHYKRRGSPLT